MKQCMICLENSGYVRYICHAYVHLKCQRLWQSNCIICRKETRIKTKQKYKYIPAPPELTSEEIELQHFLLEQINNNID